MLGRSALLLWMLAPPAPAPAVEVPRQRTQVEPLGLEVVQAAPAEVGSDAVEAADPPSQASAPAPPMPDVEELPSRAAATESDHDGGFFSDLRSPDPTRAPAGAEGGSFFDPGKLAEEGPGGGSLQIRGYVSGGFFVAQRTNTRERDASGEFERVDPLPFFGGGTATLYVGAPIWRDAIYARISLEYLSIPRPTAGTEDILAPATRTLLVESAALEINPFVWAKRTRRWFREGFKLTVGVFILPFGLEDEDHAAPINWFAQRPRVMTRARVYPGTWSDVGAAIKFKPSLGRRRPLELDLGVVNGDACTQTRFADTLYDPTGQAAPCERQLRDDELAGARPTFPLADVGFLGVAPDNNANKSVVTRLQVSPVPAANLGGSFVWGKHPRLLTTDERIEGLQTADLPQAPSWRVGGHLRLAFDEMFESPYPLPEVRAEAVYGVDAAPAPATMVAPTLVDRHLWGTYAQIAQPLWRRKRSSLPSLMVQYRFEMADPDLDVPGTVGGVPLNSDFSDGFLYDEARQGHTIGLRYPVVPRFVVKAEYTVNREDGGRTNQLADDVFALQLVADF